MRHVFHVTTEERDWILVCVSKELQLQRQAVIAFEKLTPDNLRAIATTHDNIACLENILSDYGPKRRSTTEGLEQDA